MIKKLYKKYEEVILYVVFGGLTTLVNFVSFWVFNKILGEKFYLVSNVIALFLLFLPMLQINFGFSSRKVGLLRFC